MTTHPSNVHPIRQSPLLRFARMAISHLQQDELTGVAIERIADYLCVFRREELGRETARLNQVSPRERETHLATATAIVGIIHGLAGDRPPTDAERARYQASKARGLAYARVRLQAVDHRHRLDVWRPDPDRPGYELIQCLRCGAGASIHLETARESASEALLAECPALTRGVRDAR